MAGAAVSASWGAVRSRDASSVTSEDARTGERAGALEQEPLLSEDA